MAYNGLSDTVQCLDIPMLPPSLFDPWPRSSIAGSLQIQKLGVLSELSSNGKLLYPTGYQ